MHLEVLGSELFGQQGLPWPLCLSCLEPWLVQVRLILEEYKKKKKEYPLVLNIFENITLVPESQNSFKALLYNPS